MLRSKSLLVGCALSIFTIIGILSFAIVRDVSAQHTFASDGYILVSPDSTYSDNINNKVSFEQGDRYSVKYPDKVVFHDQNNKKVVLDSDSFVHYNDGSISSLKEGVMLGLDDLDSSVMGFYGITSESVVENAGTDFVLDNQGDSLDFTNFLWKISDNKYLLVSKTITITFSNNNEKLFNDYVELSYYETGIIRIVTQEGTWQSVSSNCTAELDNGTVINLANRKIIKNGAVKLSLGQMVINSDENIKVTPTGEKFEAKVPKFDIKTEDGAVGTSGKEGKAGTKGKNGTDGIEGEEGEMGDEGDKGAEGKQGTVGEPGTPGQTGTTGANGYNGRNGSSGANGAAGANGASGEEGKSGNDVIGDTEKADVVLPRFDIASLEAKSNTVNCEFTVTDTENRLNTAKPLLIQILDNASGKEIYQSQADASLTEIPFEYNGLIPNSGYRLVLTAEYIVDNADYSKIFVNRLFNTEALGLIVTKYYALDDTLAIKVQSKDYSEIAAADLQLLDALGNPVYTKPINMTNAKEENGDIIEFNSLTPNSVYRVKVVNIELTYDDNLAVPSEALDVEYSTLKRAPVLGKASVVVNKRNNCFEFKLDSVVDQDKGIIRYRYEIYQAGNNNGADTLVKKLYSSNTDIISCYVDEIDLKRGYNYRARIVAECYDNEKQVEYASAYSDVVSMAGANFPIVLFEQDESETHHERITGTVRINTMNGSSLTVNSENPLIIQYQNSKGDVDRLIIMDEPDKLLDNNNISYVVPFTENNLLASDNYIFSIYGTLDLNDGSGPIKNTLLGSIVVRTKTPNGFTAHLSDVTNASTPIAFKLNLSDLDSTATSDYEAGTMEYIEINLYNGDESAVANSKPVATYTLTDGDADQYKSTLKDTIYGDGKSVQLTEADFGINAAAISSSKYTVEISSVRDYTKYGNKFEVQNNIKSFTKQVTLPDLDDIDKDDGLIITPITLANVSQYVSDEALLNGYQNYDANIIFGYEVSAAYFDNSAQLVNSFTYYAYEEPAYISGRQQYSDALEFYSQLSPAAKVEKTVAEGGAVPKAVFLFGQDYASGMSRGSKYVFTYRAQLKQSDETGSTVYFPEYVDNSVVIRSKTADSPYQAPRIHFYPWNSGVFSTEWKYYIYAPDTAAVIGNFAVTKGNLETAAPTLNTTDCNLKITDLLKGDSYTVTIGTSLYKPHYGAQSTNTLVSQYFESYYDLSTSGTSLYYEILDKHQENRYQISISDSSDDLSRVVGIKVEVYKDIALMPVKIVTVPLDSVTNGDDNKSVGLAYLQYGKIQEYLGNTLYFKVKAVYDNGISGFSGLVNQPGEVYRAVMITGTSGRGNYITLNYSHNGITEDTSGNAKGSYFLIKGMTSHGTSLSVNYESALDSSYKDKQLNLTNGAAGARLESLVTRPFVTLKALSDVALADKDNNEFTEVDFLSMIPSVTLNSGDAYTIDTTVTSATVHWILEGHSREIDNGNFTGPAMYMELYTVSKVDGTISGPIREITTAVSKDISDYTTEIADLQPDTKYGIKLYYMDKNGNKVYPINTYRPDVEPSTNLYTFTTSQNVSITSTSVRYVANTYVDKYLELKYSLNVVLGFDIKYSICKKNADNSYTEVLSSAELAGKDVIITPSVYNEQMQEKINISPGRLSWQEDGKTVYFPFESSDYYICIKPVSKTNADDLLGIPVYVSLKVPQLTVPFYNIKAIPGDNKTTFRISAADTGKVMVGGHYKVKVLNKDGQDITPEGSKDTVYSINAPVSIVVDVPKGDYAVLQLYTVYDMDNTGVDSEGTTLKDIGDIGYDALDEACLKTTRTGYPLSDSNFSIGDVQIAQSSSELARLYFINSVNLEALKYIRYVVVNESGVSTNYNELFTPIAEGSSRYYYELSHRFTIVGGYSIQARFYNESMANLAEIVLNYFKIY